MAGLEPSVQGPLSVVDDNQKVVGALSVVGATIFFGVIRSLSAAFAEASKEVGSCDEFALLRR